MIVGWTETRLGHLLRFRSGDTITSQDIEPHGTYPVFGGNGRRGCAEDFNVDGDSILVGRVGALCGNVHRYVGKARVSEHALIAYPLVDWNRRWMAYLLDSMKLGQWSTGTAQPVLTAATLERLRVAVPSTGVQARIADYLDRETATIDALIEKQSALVQVLRQRRGATVESAVLRGVDASVPFVPCTISWLAGASVPAHWRTPPLSALVGFSSGKTITSEAIEEGGKFPVYGGNGRRGFTSEWTHSGERLLVGRQGALCGNVHLVDGQYWASEHALVSEDRSEFDSRWLKHLLGVMDLGQYSVAAAQPGIAAGNILRLRLPVPPLDEQRQIADHLDRETAKIDALIAKAERFIELAQERRAALITAAVTGQIEIPTED